MLRQNLIDFIKENKYSIFTKLTYLLYLKLAFCLKLVLQYVYTRLPFVDKLISFYIFIFN